jgi:hypothetical protein
VINALESGDADGDGTVTFAELFNYASPRTVLVDSTQNPQSLNAAALATAAATRIPASGAIQDAVDNAELKFIAARGPYADWRRTTASWHDGTDSACSGDIPDSGASLLSAEVEGPGTLSFWWKVSSEADCDFLHFSAAGWIRSCGPAIATRTATGSPRNGRSPAG